MHDPLSNHHRAGAVGRAAHQIGLGALIGGNLFARTAMHPSLSEIGDRKERGRVLTRTWQRYGSVNGAALSAAALGWTAARLGWANPGLLTRGEARLAVAEDVAIATVAVTGIASAVAGVRFAASAPDGAVPMKDGDTPAKRAGEDSKRLKRTLNILGTAHLVSAVAASAIAAVLDNATSSPRRARRTLGRLR